MIQLYIKNQEVDITKSVGLYLNKQFESLSNPTLYYSEFSKTITLPMTANNKIILDNFCRQDSAVTNKTIDPRKKVPFQLFYNSKLVMEGYSKINNSNNIYDNSEFQIELYSSFALIMNELQQLTFNKYETVSYGGPKEDKYLIESPFSTFRLDRNIVKNSFEQTTHNLNGNDLLDYLKFIPTYQGKYPDFTSNKQQTGKKKVDELPEERDEHYMREFRSYYQQPAIWVDKMWKMLQDKVEDITDYSLVLDGSWFNQHNPYYTELIYTCPSLYKKDDNFIEETTTLDADSKNYEYNISTMGNLSSNHEKKLFFNGSGTMYRNGIFNPDCKGYTNFYMNTNIQLLAYYPFQTYCFAKLKRGNPLYVTFSAKRVSDNTTIISKTYLVYSQQTPRTNTYTYDDKKDIGVTSRFNPNMQGGFPNGYSNSDGFWWEANVYCNFEIKENIPYYITCNAKFANNSKAVHWGYLTTPNKASFIYNLFTTGTKSGYTIFSNVQNAECKTIDFIRSRSDVDMYRVFPKDTTLLSVLLNYSKMFGLLWDVDIDSKKVTVCTRNKYFSNYKILDWSKKVDRNHDFILEPICFDKRYVTFNFEDGRGPKFENYKKKYNYSYGSKKIDTEFQFNSDTEDLFKGIQPSLVSQKSQSSIVFNTTKPNESDYVGANYKVYPDEHYIDNDNEGSNAENSGAFYFFNGTMQPDLQLGYKSEFGYPVVFITDDTEYMQKNDEYYWNLSGENIAICTKLPNISTIDRSGQYSVHFVSPKEYYFKVNSGDTDYVYELFWEEFINERYNIQNKKLTAYFYLTPQEYDAIKFKDFVKIENTLYHVNKVVDYDYDTNAPVKVELVQVWDLNKYTIGQKDWKVISVTPDIIDINNQEWREVNVYCPIDDGWEITSKPSWVDIQIEGNWLKLKASSNPLRSRSGSIVLSTTGSEVLSTTLKVTQKPNTTYLNLSKNNITVSADGATVQIEVDSIPQEITITSKPNWITDVTIKNRTLMQFANANILEDFSANKVGDFTISFGVNKNVSTLSRKGTITITNDYHSKDFTIIQLGSPIIYEDWSDEVIDINIGSSGTFGLITNKEIDVNSVDITNLGIVNKPQYKVDNVNITFSPSLDLTDYGDGTIETCTGGEITITTLDGFKISKNYNYGTTIPSYHVIIGSGTNGHISIGGVDYYSTYIEDIPSGSTINVNAIPDTDYIFDSWSDGNSNANRTITVNSDINIYPIFEYYIEPTAQVSISSISNITQNSADINIVIQ